MKMEMKSMKMVSDAKICVMISQIIMNVKERHGSCLTPGCP